MAGGREVRSGKPRNEVSEEEGPRHEGRRRDDPARTKGALLFPLSHMWLRSGTITVATSGCKAAAAAVAF